MSSLSNFLTLHVLPSIPEDEELLIVADNARIRRRRRRSPPKRQSSLSRWEAENNTSNKMPKLPTRQRELSVENLEGLEPVLKDEAVIISHSLLPVKGQMEMADTPFSLYDALRKTVLLHRALREINHTIPSI